MITLNFDATSEPANPITPLVIDFVINGLDLRQALYSAAISYNNPFLDRLILLKSGQEKQMMLSVKLDICWIKLQLANHILGHILHTIY